MSTDHFASLNICLMIRFAVILALVLNSCRALDPPLPLVDPLANLPEGPVCRAKSENKYECVDAVISQGEKAESVNFGVSQRVDGTDAEKLATLKAMMNMYHYVWDEVFAAQPGLFAKCKNRHELCAFWASLGKCETNRIYMLHNCAPACQFCLLANTNLGAYHQS